MQGCSLVLVPHNWRLWQIGSTWLPDPNPSVAPEGISLQTVSKDKSIGGNCLNSYLFWLSGNQNSLGLLRWPPVQTHLKLRELWMRALQMPMYPSLPNSMFFRRVVVMAALNLEGPVIQVATSYQSSASFTFPGFWLQKDSHHHFQLP